MKNSRKFDLDAIRNKMRSQKGVRFWRSLQELAESEGFQPYLESEFPTLGAWSENLDRRTMLQLIGASIALAGMTACSSPPLEKIVPYVHDPEGLVPGHPISYASAMPLSGYGKGVLVESHMGRPTKVEGNPRHPASLGATDIFGQASTLGLYDPDRSHGITFEGRISSWTAFSAALNGRLEDQELKKGAGLRILTETVTSPTFAAQMQAILQRFPQARWHRYEPADSDGARDGSRIAFGQDVNTFYQLDQADVILSLDSDFLTRGPAWLRYSRQWAARRQREPGLRGMNRLYAVESTPTCTGAVADHRLALRAWEIENFARAVARKIGVKAAPPPSSAPQADSRWVEIVSSELLAHRGGSLVVPGEDQPGSLHALAHALNQVLGNNGTTVIYTDPVEANRVNSVQSLRELTEDMRDGKVDMLRILGSNPVFTAPADLGFTNALKKTSFAVHFGLNLVGPYCWLLLRFLSAQPCFSRAGLPPG
jgi:MoCo/4Fe-4S cofactor protein with predicted Tat translocation signal